MAKATKKVVPIADTFETFGDELAEAFLFHAEALLMELMGKAEHVQLTPEQAQLIGAWSRLKLFERMGGNEMWLRHLDLFDDEKTDQLLDLYAIQLTEKEWKYLFEEGKYEVTLPSGHPSGLPWHFEYSDKVRTTLTAKQKLQMQAWHSADSGQRAIGFGVEAMTRILSGKATGHEAIALFRTALEMMEHFHSANHEDWLKEKAISAYAATEAQKLINKSRELNALRHRANRAAKELVCAEWEKNTSAFASAEKAGAHFADWLIDGRVMESIEPRTVAGWIRAYAKKKGIRLR